MLNFSTFILSVALLSSLIINFILYFKIKYLKKENPKESSYEVKELLQDLLSGSALVKVSRISSEDVFFRSMRDR
jgi:hypothetical protein